MSGHPDPPIKTTALVVELRENNTYIVRYPNGKLAHAHLSHRLKEKNTVLELGDSVEMELTPFDFDHGRIAEKK